MPFLLQTATETITKSVEDYYDKFLEILPRIALGILVIVIGILLAQLVTNIYKKRILKKAEDPLMARFLAQAIKIILTLIAIMIALQIAGLSGVATGILTAAGGAAIVLGFAFQDIGKNFLAGIILAFNRPFNVNDTIKVADLFGRESHIDNYNFSKGVLANRKLLREGMQKVGFQTVRTEWWHYSFRKNWSYPVMNEPLPCD